MLYGFGLTSIMNLSEPVDSLRRMGYNRIYLKDVKSISYDERHNAARITIQPPNFFPVDRLVYLPDKNGREIYEKIVELTGKTRQ